MNLSCSLKVDGETGFETYIRHTGDANTCMYITADRWQLETRGRNMIDVQYIDKEVDINESRIKADPLY